MEVLALLRCGGAAQDRVPVGEATEALDDGQVPLGVAEERRERVA
jgi:hypothetical protein